MFFFFFSYNIGSNLKPTDISEKAVIDFNWIWIRLLKNTILILQFSEPCGGIRSFVKRKIKHYPSALVASYTHFIIASHVQERVDGYLITADSYMIKNFLGWHRLLPQLHLYSSQTTKSVTKSCHSLPNSEVEECRWKKFPIANDLYLCSLIIKINLLFSILLIFFFSPFQKSVGYIWGSFCS